MNILNTNQGLYLCWYIRWASLLLVIYVNIKFKNRSLKCEGILGSSLYPNYDVCLCQKRSRGEHTFSLVLLHNIDTTSGGKLMAFLTDQGWCLHYISLVLVPIVASAKLYIWLILAFISSIDLTCVCWRPGRVCGVTSSGIHGSQCWHTSSG